MNAVAGVGPRTGTSWVMGKLREAGLHVHGHKILPDLMVPQHNPEGYWELDPNEPMPTDGICKLWGIWNYPDIDKVVVLERLDVEAQLRSMDKVLQDELKLSACRAVWQDHWTNTMILTAYVQHMYQWLKTRDPKKTMVVYTETLDSEINNIINFFQQESQCQ